MLMTVSMETTTSVIFASLLKSASLPAKTNRNNQKTVSKLFRKKITAMSANPTKETIHCHPLSLRSSKRNANNAAVKISIPLQTVFKAAKRSVKAVV